jgi:hypothetical protein
MQQAKLDIYPVTWLLVVVAAVAATLVVAVVQAVRYKTL